MRDGFLTVAAVNMASKSIDENVKNIISLSKKAARKAKLIVFPELSLTGADLRDMFYQLSVYDMAGKALIEILKGTQSLDALIFVGMPVMRDGKVYDCVVVINKGEVIGVVPRGSIPTDAREDRRPFCSGESEMVFTSDAIPGLSVGVAIGGDIDSQLIFGGYKPTVLINPSAVFEYAGKAAADEARLTSIGMARHCAVVHVNAGPGGASTDGIYAGGAIITGTQGVVCKAPVYREGITYGVIDIQALLQDRGRDTLFNNDYLNEPERTEFDLDIKETVLWGSISPHPFYPVEKGAREEYCREVFEIQKHALMERMQHIGTKKAVVGVSGGLDSTLALLVAKEAIETFGYPKKNLLALTLPGFGTTDRTYENAVGMIKALGADFREISIKDAVNIHFKDIGQKEGVYDLTFENAQARERTQILMDVAGREKALMVGTGDLSELALGWCTFNGDHMSMYAVNAGLSKTLIREVVRQYADTCGSKKLAGHLLDVVATPISPELMPAKKGKNAQKTEDKVGPYELSDFFLYYTLRYGFKPDKIKRLAISAFKGTFTAKDIDKWLEVFLVRFTSQAFKRSCMPDGPGICGLSLSPRHGFRMPSDVSVY